MQLEQVKKTTLKLVTYGRQTVESILTSDWTEGLCKYMLRFVKAFLNVIV